MALETWLIKVKTAITHRFDSVITSAPIPRSSSRKSNVGVLAFESAALMSKLFHLWQSLSDSNIVRLRNESICLEGVRKIVSNDESFLLGLACAEIAENIRLVAKSVSRFSKRCDDAGLRRFETLFDDFANSGHDPNGWVLSLKEMEGRNKKMDRYVTVTATLYKEMEELSTLENSLRKCMQSADHEQSPAKEQKIMDLQQKIFWQRQEVKYLKERSLWNRSFDAVVSMLARSIFTVLARNRIVFGIGSGYPTSLPRSLSASATVHPTDHNPSTTYEFTSGPLSSKLYQKDSEIGFFDTNSKLLKPPATTLGAAALALHYANLIIVMEKMIKSPQLVGVDARDDLYAMLPISIRSSLRARLKGVGFTASDPVLAGEWRNALGRILGWLSPLAHNMIKWQNERSFEQQNLVAKTNVLLFQTLFFANKDKTEAAITELLVGLNYIWRFEREMTAKALFECANFNNNGLISNSQMSSCRS